MEKEYTIASEKSYHELMVEIYDLMNKGEANLSPSELDKLAKMTHVAEEYEDAVLKLKPAKQPDSINEAIEQFMFTHKLTQAKLATELGIGKPKLSQILTGKRQPDVPFLKLIYRKLNLDPKFIMDHV